MKKPEKVETAILPTPIRKMNRLTDSIGKANIYIKRDDMTGLAFGGNKLRKLDYIIKYCLDNGYTTVITFGGNQTNHGRLTAAACAKYGLKCVIITSGKPVKHMSGNITLDRILGCELVFFDPSKVSDEFDALSDKQKNIERKEFIKKYLAVKENAIDQTKKRYEAMGEKVYLLPIGGHTNEGIFGYFDAVPEIMKQEKEMGIKFDYVVVGNGSGGTLAGLMLGNKHYKAGWKLIAPSISTKRPEEIEKLINDANKCSDAFEIETKVSMNDIYLWTNDYTGIGYNIPDKPTREVIERIAQLEGIIVDPCYTGKVATCLIDLVEKEKIEKNANVLFIHTGGTPAIYTKEHQDAFDKELWHDVIGF